MLAINGSAIDSLSRRSRRRRSTAAGSSWATATPRRTCRRSRTSADIRKTTEAIARLHRQARRAAGSAPASPRPGTRPTSSPKKGYDYVCDWVLDDQPVRLKTRSGADRERALHAGVQRRRDDADPASQGVASIATARSTSSSSCTTTRATRARVMALVVHPYIMGAPHRAEIFPQHASKRIRAATRRRVLDRRADPRLVPLASAPACRDRSVEAHVAFQLLNGLTFAALLFVVASGFTLIFGLLRIVNLAHGALYLFGGYIGFTVAARTGSFPVAASPPWRRRVLRSRSRPGLLRFVRGFELRQVLLTLGVAFVLNDLALVIWGGDTFTVATPEWLQGAIVRFGVVLSEIPPFRAPRRRARLHRPVASAQSDAAGRAHPRRSRRRRDGRGLGDRHPPRVPSDVHAGLGLVRGSADCWAGRF